MFDAFYMIRYLNFKIKNQKKLPKELRLLILKK